MIEGASNLPKTNMFTAGTNAFVSVYWQAGNGAGAGTEVESTASSPSGVSVSVPSLMSLGVVFSTKTVKGSCHPVFDNEVSWAVCCMLRTRLTSSPSFTSHPKKAVLLDKPEGHLLSASSLLLIVNASGTLSTIPIGYIALSGPQLQALADAANIHGGSNSAGLVTTMELVPWMSRGMDVAVVGGGATDPKISTLPSLSFRLRVVAALPPSVWDFSSPCPDGFKGMELTILGAFERRCVRCVLRLRS